MCIRDSDGTAWMAMFSQNMLELALMLAEDNPAYEDDVIESVSYTHLTLPTSDLV